MKIRILALLLLAGLGLAEVDEELESFESFHKKLNRRSVFSLGFGSNLKSQGSQPTHDLQNSGHNPLIGSHDLGLEGNYGDGHHGDVQQITITKEVPYPVPHPIPVPVEKKVPVPYPVKVHVPVYRPYPVHVPKPYPVPVEKKVPYPVIKRIPYPVKVPVKVPVKIPVPVFVPKPIIIPVHKKVPVPVKVPVVVVKKVPVLINNHGLFSGHKRGSYGSYYH